jgi:hypothetical protein
MTFLHLARPFVRPALARRRRVKGVGFGFSPTGSPARMTPSLASQPCPHIHVWLFGRFDEITDLIENASALTLAPRSWRGSAEPPRRPSLISSPVQCVATATAAH